MLVRDPVVVAGTLPRFLAPGDATRMRFDLHNVAHAAGEYSLAVMAGGPVVLDPREQEADSFVARKRAAFRAADVALAASGTVSLELAAVSTQTTITHYG